MRPLPPAPTYYPNCKAKYEVVRRAPALADHREVTCLSCGGSLPGRESAFVVKYFLVDRPTNGSGARARSFALSE